MKHLISTILLLALPSVTMQAQTISSLMEGNTTHTTAIDDSLKVMRQQIDSIDSQLIDLLARRMQVCLAVGEYKKRKGIAVIQTNRYHEILEKRSLQGADKGLNPAFVKSIMNLIHDESVLLQDELLHNSKDKKKGQSDRSPGSIY